MWVRRQADPPRDGDEAGVGAQLIEPEIHIDREELEAAVAAGSREPLVALLHLAEREVNRQELEGRHVALSPEVGERAEDLPRLVGFARQRERAGQRALH